MDDQLQFGPERLILFHSPDPDELGIRLDHGPDGRVRIVSVPSDEERSPGGSSTGIIEGKISLGDVVMEAAGVNLRRPVSDHMWKLTTGLMRVSPRPLEIIVAEEQFGNEAGGEPREGSYYQLSVANDTSALAPTMHRMPVSPGAIGHHSYQANAANDIIPPCSPVETEVNAVFDDPARFGPERTVTFYTQSLGIKLHRDPAEGIVHILKVERVEHKSKLGAGDAIFEVGGVSLRGKVIGMPEWADMVHFIKHVGRPLDMVVAKDGAFDASSLGNKVPNVPRLEAEDKEYQPGNEMKTVMEAIVEEQEKKEDAEIPKAEKTDADDAGEEKKETDAKEEEVMQAEADAMFGDANCFNVTLDDICTLPTEDICNLPCVGAKKDKPWETDAAKEEVKSDVGSSVISSPKKKDDSWIKKFDAATAEDAEEAPAAPISPKEEGSPKKKDNSWIKKPAAEETAASSGPEKDASPTKKDNSWIKKPSSPESPSGAIAGPTLVVDASKTNAIPSMYPRTSPIKTKPTSSPDKPAVSPKNEESSEPVETKSVAVLKDMFSPIQPPAAATLQPKVSPIVVPSEEESGGALDEESKRAETKAELKGLFSPIVAEPATPKTPTEDYSIANGEDAKTTPSAVATQLPSPTLRTDSPGNWSAAASASSPISTSSVARSLASVRSAGSTDGGKPPAIPLSPAQEMAQSILKEKRSSPKGYAWTEETPVKAPLEPSGAKDAQQLEATPADKQPIDTSTAEESPFHSVFLKNLHDEFRSPDKTLQNTESRDDADEVKPSASFGKKDATILPKPEKKNHVLAARPEEQSPTGSTVSVEDRKTKTPTTTKTPFGERSFRAVDTESPFVGNIKFATPTKRVPQSTLFSQAFVVQHQADANGEEAVNVRWLATESPLFVAPGNAEPASGGSSYLQLHSPRVQPPTEDPNTSAFDMTSLEDSLLDGEASEGSFELNETIVYADNTEAENPMDCCGASAFCGSEMFEGLVQNCGDMDAFKQQKEKRNKIPSPRRKNLLSRLRKKGKKNKDRKKAEYGNLDDDEEREEARPKGVRRAHVQLARQKVGGMSVASANQFSLLLDDEICV